MAINPRNAPAEARKGRLSLKTWRPRNCSKLAGTEQPDDTATLTDAQRFAASIWDERNAWSIDRHRLPEDADEWLSGGGWASRRLNKQEASELLGLAFAAIDKGARA